MKLKNISQDGNSAWQCGRLAFGFWHETPGAGWVALYRGRKGWYVRVWRIILAVQCEERPAYGCVFCWPKNRWLNQRAAGPNQRDAGPDYGGEQA